MGPHCLLRGLAYSGSSGRSSPACAEVRGELLLKERFRGKKNSEQEGRAFKMNEIVQRSFELCMLHCETGGDSPGSSKPCHRSNMPQT